MSRYVLAKSGLYVKHYDGIGPVTTESIDEAKAWNTIYDLWADVILDYGAEKWRLDWDVVEVQREWTIKRTLTWQGFYDALNNKTE